MKAKITFITIIIFQLNAFNFILILNFHFMLFLFKFIKLKDVYADQNYY